MQYDSISAIPPIEILSLGQRIRAFFHLKADTDEQGTIDYIRANVEFKSANAWTLVFAIIIASVGLNTNSSAVIIGAMLISPLMGPIVGMGLGLGINDIHLIKRSLANLGAAVFISVLASTLYFLISPLSEVQSELLARTRPSFFDVIIAVFGGAAGIVALSRRERGNAIPGVAIATALMPPLCTAGFGIATGQLRYFLGAIYLFVINGVFICISTFVFVRYLKFRRVTRTDHASQVRLNRWVLSVALVVIIPSLILAWILQRENSFRSQAGRFIKQQLKFEHSFVVNHEVDFDWSHPKIKVGIVGETLTDNQIAELKKKLQDYGLSSDVLEIQQSSVAEGLEKKFNDQLSSKDEAAREADLKFAQVEVELQAFKKTAALSSEITAEIEPLFSKLAKVVLTREEPTGTVSGGVTVYWRSHPSRKEQDNLAKFLKRRLDAEAISGMGQNIDQVIEIPELRKNSG